MPTLNFQQPMLQSSVSHDSSEFSTLHIIITVDDIICHGKCHFFSKILW